jgi:hypothetical protein
MHQLTALRFCQVGGRNMGDACGKGAHGKNFKQKQGACKPKPASFSGPDDSEAAFVFKNDRACHNKVPSCVRHVCV